MKNRRKALLVSAVFLLSALMASATTVPTALASIDGNYSIVWGYNASNATVKWQRYIPNNITANTLTAINPEFGYWVNINSSNETLTVTGTVPSSTSVSLLQSWNLVGYPSLTSQTVSAALASIDGNYSIVWGYNASNATVKWQRYIPNNITANTLTAMNSGFGYWINLNVSTETLVI